MRLVDTGIRRPMDPQDGPMGVAIVELTELELLDRKIGLEQLIEQGASVDTMKARLAQHAEVCAALVAAQRTRVKVEEEEADRG